MRGFVSCRTSVFGVVFVCLLRFEPYYPLLSRHLHCVCVSHPSLPSCFVSCFGCVRTRRSACRFVWVCAHAGTRCVLCCTYLTLVIAIVLTVLLKLQFDTTTLLLPSPPCLSAAAGGGELGSPVPMPGCVAAGPGVNGTTWSGGVQDMSALSGDISLQLLVSDPTPAALEQPVFEFSSTVSGKDGSAWEQLYVIANATAVVQCTAQGDGNGASCKPITVVSSFISTHGQGGAGYPAYRMQVQYPDTNLSALGTVRYQFRYRLPAFQVGLTVLRALLIIVTLVALVRYTLAVVRMGVPFSQWMPHRNWVQFLLVVLLFWQNPLLVGTTLVRSVPVELRVVTLCIQGVGWAGIFVFWLLVMDSLKYPPMELPPRFYLWKGVFGVVFALTLMSLQVLKNLGPLFYNSRHIKHPDAVLGASLFVGCMFVLCLLVWVAWFICAARSTRKALAKEPYAVTRFRQLLYRFLIFQQVVVMLFSVAVNAVPVVEFFVGYIQHPS